MFDINDDTKGGYRRIELLTGPGRRRRWSAEEKERIIAESLAPGARVSEVARRWELSPSAGVRLATGRANGGDTPRRGHGFRVQPGSALVRADRHGTASGIFLLPPVRAGDHRDPARRSGGAR